MAERRGLRSEVRYQRSERRQDAIRSSKIAQRFSAGNAGIRNYESQRDGRVLSSFQDSINGGRCCPSTKPLRYDQEKTGYALEPRRAIELVTCHWSLF